MDKLVKVGIGSFVTLVIVVISGFWFFEKIDNGNVGIRYSMSGGVRKQSLSQGVHFVGLDKVTQYPIRTQTTTEKVGLATEDGKKTDVKLTYNFHVDPTKAVSVYRKFGSANIETIEKGWLSQKLQKAGRDTLAKHTLLEVTGSDAGKVQADILNSFQKEVENQGFIVEDLSFGVPAIDQQTQKSIDDLIRAGQDNKKAELEAKTQKTKAEGDASAKVVSAEADAKTKQIAAQAEADANKKINDSVTQTTIDYMIAQARKDKGWVTVQGNGGVIVDKDK
ncbi:prohibitin family protein [Leuconostoc sp. MS02]|uniref:Prohibitin family protein n=1 Tax=Leuconostoc aquikimchii TaxID=3236804 RepID=A0ABV3S207_9LACO